jgi:hypothetical protein
MIFKRRLDAVILLLLCSTFVATKTGDDFRFDSDDLQVREITDLTINYNIGVHVRCVFFTHKRILAFRMRVFACDTFNP